MIRATTNIAGLERVAPPEVSVVFADATDARSFLALLRACLRSDYCVLHFEPRVVFGLALCLWATPFASCRVIALDLFLPADAPSQPRWKVALFNFLLSRVHLFLVYVRDMRHYCRYYRFRPDQLKYIPFKVNALELIEAANVYDGGYIFSGGKSRRDFATLIEAAQPLAIPVRIVTAGPDELARHGSSLPARIPPGVEVMTSDNSIEYFIREMAGARLVVLPVTPNVVTQAGIAVYLMAMALGKCVIVSAGPGVEDVLTEGQAIIVPAGDEERLREAIDRAWSDDEYRSAVAARGFEYAQRLGGTDVLLRNIAMELVDVRTQAQPAGAQQRHR